METEILKQHNFPLLKRKRISAMIEFEVATPSKQQVIDSLSSKLKTDKDLISVRHIYQKFGSRKAKVIAHIYEDKDSLNKIEKINKKKKVEKKEEKKAE